MLEKTYVWILLGWNDYYRPSGYEGKEYVY